MTHTPARSAPHNRRILMGSMHDSFLVAVMAAVAVISPRLRPAPRCQDLKGRLRIRRMLAVLEQASSVLLADLAAGTALTQRPTLSQTNMVTTQCRT